MALFPPLNFNAVEEGLYRSGMPFETNFEVLLHVAHSATLLTADN